MARIDDAFAAYLDHRASLGQASVIAHMPVTVFLAEARRAGVLLCWRDGE